MSQPQKQKNTRTMTQFWTVFLLIATLVAVGAGFWGWKYWNYSGENERFEVSISNTSKRLESLAPGSAARTRTRTEAAKKADDHRIIWSDIMAQALSLETKTARFSSLNIEGEKVTATVQAGNWDSLSKFVDSLRSNAMVQEVRVSTTTLLKPAISGATQEAQVRFIFTPTSK